MDCIGFNLICDGLDNCTSPFRNFPGVRRQKLFFKLLWITLLTFKFDNFRRGRRNKKSGIFSLNLNLINLTHPLFDSLELSLLTYQPLCIVFINPIPQSGILWSSQILVET